METDAYNKEKETWFLGLVAKGHEPILDKDDELDVFVLDSDYHNGPGCNKCGLMWCMHCGSIHDIKKCQKP